MAAGELLRNETGAGIRMVAVALPTLLTKVNWGSLLCSAKPWYSLRCARKDALVVAASLRSVTSGSKV